METILSGAGTNPIVVGGHEKHRDNEDCIRDHGLFNASSIERFGLKNMSEVSDLRREVAESKYDLALKVLEDGEKTRHILREQELDRLREQADTWRAQLIAAGVVPGG